MRKMKIVALFSAFAFMAYTTMPVVAAEKVGKDTTKCCKKGEQKSCCKKTTKCTKK